MSFANVSQGGIPQSLEAIMEQITNTAMCTIKCVDSFSMVHYPYFVLHFATVTRNRAQETINTYTSRYRRFVESADELSRLITAATGIKCNIRDHVTLDYIRKFGLDAGIVILILKYQYLLPFKHPVSGIGVRNKDVVIYASNGAPNVQACMFLLPDL